MSLESKVGIGRPNSPSLRTTIPEGIVAFLELKKGDKLEWKMDVSKDGKRTVIVRRVKNT